MSSIRDLITTGRFLKGGWQDKYRITRADGSPVDPEAVYFPLRLDNDPYAREAALYYADRIEKVNPQLADDIRKKVAEGEETHTHNTGYGAE